MTILNHLAPLPAHGGVRRTPGVAEEGVGADTHPGEVQPRQARGPDAHRGVGLHLETGGPGLDEEERRDLAARAQQLLDGTKAVDDARGHSSRSPA